MRCARPARVVDASDWRISFPVEIRVAPADDIALSTAHDRDSFYLAFHIHHAPTAHPHGVLRRDGARSCVATTDGPHWGKLHTRTAADLGPAYPRFGDFVALRDRLDPDRLFTNPYLAGCSATERAGHPGRIGAGRAVRPTAAGTSRWRRLGAHWSRTAGAERERSAHGAPQAHRG